VKKPTVKFVVMVGILLAAFFTGTQTKADNSSFPPDPKGVRVVDRAIVFSPMTYAVLYDSGKKWTLNVYIDKKTLDWTKAYSVKFAKSGPIAMVLSGVVGDEVQFSFVEELYSEITATVIYNTKTGKFRLQKTEFPN
jgi:hypothetical protein